MSVNKKRQKKEEEFVIKALIKKDRPSIPTLLVVLIMLTVSVLFTRIFIF